MGRDATEESHYVHSYGSVQLIGQYCWVSICVAHISPLIYLPLMLTNPDNDIVIHDLFPTKLCPHFKIVCVPTFSVGYCASYLLYQTCSFFIHHNQPLKAFCRILKSLPLKFWTTSTIIKECQTYLHLKCQKHSAGPRQAQIQVLFLAVCVRVVTLSGVQSNDLQEGPDVSS